MIEAGARAATAAGMRPVIHQSDDPAGASRPSEGYPGDAPWLLERLAVDQLAVQPPSVQAERSVLQRCACERRFEKGRISGPFTPPAVGSSLLLEALADRVAREWPLERNIIARAM